MTKLHLVKLSVGTESVASKAAWQAENMALTGNQPRHVTRMWPRRAEELLDGGSIYWVIKGQVLVRQKIIRLDEVIGQDSIRRCGIVLDPVLMQTVPQPRRAFQGWRYLKAEDAPRDTTPFIEGVEELPLEMQSHLAALGVL
ncbi:MAG: DUF1489 domain-containing protein [Rhodobacteraceae bacterium]|nr:DUF1489 domain-containing protein [Paracoccaceae bacterium]